MRCRDYEFDIECGLAQMLALRSLAPVLAALILLTCPRESCAAITAFTYDANGNQISQQTAVAAPPVILGSPPNQVATLGGVGGFSVTVSSPLPVTYQWYLNGVAISGATGDSLRVADITSANDGNYTVVVTNSSGSVTSATFTLGIDSNGNGLPDSWEIAVFGNLNQTAGGDYDGDSISNLDEYFNGTDPKVREVYHWVAQAGDFNNPTNWSRNRIPGVGDTAIIDSGTFTLPANATITASYVTVNAPFTVPVDTNFSLNITGTWIFNGQFSLADGREFAVTGGGSATITGATSLNGANLLADGGSQLTFSAVTAYTAPGGTSVSWVAQHPGTVLSFPNLTTITGPNTPGKYFDLIVRYDNGPNLSLPALTTITKPDDGDPYHNSGVRFFADSGTISAPNLSVFIDGDSHADSSLNAYSNGVLTLPQLTDPQGVNINLNAPSHPERFRSLARTRFFEVNSGTVAMGNLNSITGLSSILADGGAQLSFPNVTSYAVSDGISVQWIAQHPGTVLSFPNLTTITGPSTPNVYLDLIARYDDGATISLPVLATITKPDDGDPYNNSGVRFFADNSTISAPNLSVFNDNDSRPDSSLNASSNGVLALPQLTDPHGVNINLNAQSHPEQFTSLVGTRFFQVNSGTVVMSKLNAITGFSSIVASGGAQLSFPNVANYTVPSGMSVQWVAQNRGTMLSFPNLTMITGPATAGTYFDLIARYDNGATLSLPILTTIIKPDDGDPYANSGVRFFVDSSTISAPYLSIFYDNDSHPGSSLNAGSGGTMVLASLALSGLRGVTLNGVALPGTLPNPKAINLSTRMRVQTGDEVGIGGFIITGNTPKHVIIRAIGPSLATFNVPNVLADPVLELHGPGAFATIRNDNWRESQNTEVEATGIPPGNDLESAIVATLAPGPYTAIVAGTSNASGIGLVEVYDLNQSVDSRLANLSTRAFVNLGDNIVIAGFILSVGSGADRVVVRGIGPSLTAAGLANPLADPALELRDANGVLLISNNDWQDDAAKAAEISKVGLAPSNEHESALVVILPPGLYSALLSGNDGGTGIGVVEVYDLGGGP